MPLAPGNGTERGGGKREGGYGKLLLPLNGGGEAAEEEEAEDGAKGRERGGKCGQALSASKMYTEEGKESAGGSKKDGGRRSTFFGTKENPILPSFFFLARMH